MSWIRSNLTLVVIVIAIAIVAFVVQDGCNAASRGGGSASGPTSVGTIAGQEISRQEFGELYDRVLTNARQGGRTLTDQDRQQALNSTWQQFLRNKVYESDYAQVGVGVTPQELSDLFTGDPVHSQVSQYFGSFFQSQGKDMNGASVAEYLDQVEQSQDLAAIEQFRDFEKAIKRFREQEKLDKILQGAYMSSNAEARRQYVAENRKADVSYVAVPYSTISDSIVNVSDSDFQSFIKKNDHRFKQEASTSFRYVKFDIIPTAADTARAANRANRYRKAFAASTNDSLYVAGKTRTPYSNVARPVSTIPSSILDSLMSGTVGQVFGPVREFDHFKMYKLTAIENSDDELGKARYIMIPFGSDTAEAKSKARDLSRQANASNFADLMADNNGRAATWFGERTIDQDAFEAVSDAKAGKIIGPIKTSRGFAVFHVMEKTNKKFAYLDIEERIFASDKTSEEVFKQASTFSAKVGNGTLEAVAAQDGLSSQSADKLTSTSFSVAGIQEGARSLVLWALDAPLNEVSEIKSVDNAYVVAQVTEKRAEGLQSVDDVRTFIRAEVYNEKKADYILNKLNASGDLNSIASSYGNGVSVQTVSGVNFASPSFGSANEPLLVGTIMGMQKDAMSGPIEGKQGVYVVQVTNITEAAEPSEADLMTIKMTKSASGPANFQAKASQAMQELSGVEDTRAKAGY
ncbi:MAG: SurA N-terminal domain-containing protein [Bacteroidia bacterium]